MSFVAAVSRTLSSTRTISAPRRTASARRVVAVAPRASSAETTDAPTATPTTTTKKIENAVFFRGESFTEAEYEQKKLSGEIDDLSNVEVAKYAEPPSFGEIMAFSGPAPEALNGRLCMLGLLAGVAAEISTQKSISEQFSSEPTLVVATALIFAAATFAPLISNVEVLAPAGFVRNFFTEKAETMNGRAAMVGFGSLLIIEALKGSALF